MFILDKRYLMRFECIREYSIINLCSTDQFGKPLVGFLNKTQGDKF